MQHAFLNLITTSGALALAVSAGWLDWRSRRIPNRLTLPALALGLAINSLAGGWQGVKFAFEGAGLGFGLLLPFVLLRGLGAGDWKLMGALGAFLGPERLLTVLFGTILIAGFMAIVTMVRARRVKQTLANLAVLIHAFVTFRLKPQRGIISLDNPDLISLPFGVAAAAATMIFVVVLFAHSAFKIS
jgi:prepilin peptidase CpaA